MSQKIHEANKLVGWWDNPERCLFETIQLISTEVAEATEGERKNLMDDHLPHRRMGEVELADALIRTLDLCGKLQWPEFSNGDDDEGIIMIAVNPLLSVGRRHLLINSYLVVVAEELELVSQFGDDGAPPMNLFMALMDLVRMIISVSASFGYDIVSAMEEKLVYNSKRADHKRENRALENGKKF